MSLPTPSKIRELQNKLYRKTKNEPRYRFYLLYDKIWREDILAHAYEVARANQGAPGGDGESFGQIETGGRQQWLNGLREELRHKRYRPQPVRRVMIPKAGGGERPLGIPTIRDRVVQTAAKIVLEPIFEADLEPNAYGYRPKQQARKESFDFLGYTFGPHRYRKDGHWYLGASPSKKGGPHQREGERPSGARQNGTVGGSAGAAESDSERLVGVLQLWDPDDGVSGSG
jgi:hypothetical protein